MFHPELLSGGQHWDFGQRWKIKHVQNHWNSDFAVLGAKPGSGLVLTCSNSTTLNATPLRLEAGRLLISWWAGQHLHYPHANTREGCHKLTWNVETICASLSRVKKNSTWVITVLEEGKTENNVKAEVKHKWECLCVPSSAASALQPAYAGSPLITAVRQEKSSAQLNMPWFNALEINLIFSIYFL